MRCIQTISGSARFISPSAVAVGDTKIAFARCCIATGARAADLPIPGLKEVLHSQLYWYQSRTIFCVFSLVYQPRVLNEALGWLLDQ